MSITRVNLNLSHLTPLEKVSTWGGIKADMTGNGNFPIPSPTLAAIDTEVNKLALAISAAQSGDHSKIAAMKAQEKKVDNLLSQLGNYVESTANNLALSGADAEAVIASAGMSVEGPREKAPVPDAPMGLSGTSLVEGEIELTFKSAEHARAYIVEISDDLATLNATNIITTTSSVTAQVYTNWKMVDACLKPKITLSGLISGTKYAVRITSVGTAGKSAPSIMVVVKVH